MCEIKTVLVFLALLKATSSSLSRRHTEKKVGQQSRNNIKGRCEIEYKGYCLKGEW